VKVASLASASFRDNIFVPFLSEQNAGLPGQDLDAYIQPTEHQVQYTFAAAVIWHDRLVRLLLLCPWKHTILTFGGPQAHNLKCIEAYL